VIRRTNFKNFSTAHKVAFFCFLSSLFFVSFLFEDFFFGVYYSFEILRLCFGNTKQTFQEYQIPRLASSVVTPIVHKTQRNRKKKSKPRRKFFIFLFKEGKKKNIKKTEWLKKSAQTAKKKK